MNDKFNQLRESFRRQPRFLQYCETGIVIWAIGFTMFCIEVYHFHMEDHGAKLSISLLLPVSLAVHWLIWGDKRRCLSKKIGFLTAIGVLTSRWCVVRFIFFLGNQVAYGAIRHKTGWTPWQVNLVIAPPISLIAYFVNHYVVFERYGFGLGALLRFKWVGPISRFTRTMAVRIWTYGTAKA